MPTTINPSDQSITQYNIQTGGASNLLNNVAPSATSGVPFISQGSSSQPVFGTAVVAGGGTGNTTFTAYSVICAGTTATGTFQNVSGVGSSGQILTSNGASNLPTWQAAPAGGLTWSVQTGTSVAGVANNGYIANNAGTVVVTLPATSAVGDTIAVTGINNATGWKVAQNAGNQIFFGTSSTTSGATGYIQSAATRDTATLVCMTANATWNVISSVGNITVF